VLAIARTTLAPATIRTVFCTGSNNSEATRSELTPGHSICPVAGYDGLESLGDRQEIAGQHGSRSADSAETGP
jgi:hypothetical protein